MKKVSAHICIGLAFFMIAASLSVLSCGSGDEAKKKPVPTKAKKKVKKSRGETAVGLYPRNETFYVGGFLWGNPETFNPLAWDPAWPVAASVKLTYESLFAYDQLTNKLEPLLAKSYKNLGDRIEVVMNENAKWSDGQPLTGDDVKYTFEFGKDYDKVPVNSFWNYVKEIQLEKNKETGDKLTFWLYAAHKNEDPANPLGKEVAKTAEEKVELKALDAKADASISGDDSGGIYNPLIVLDVFSVMPILSKKYISGLLKAAGGKKDDVLKHKMDKGAVISGPYAISEYTNEKVVLKRRDDYWGNDALYGGKKPAPKHIIHPIFKSNDSGNLALQNGDLDVSQNFMPKIWKKFEKGVGTWFKEEPYYLSGTIPTLILNLTMKPFDDPAFRRALAHSIDFEKIKRLAVSRYTDELQPGFILPFGPESKYFSKEDTDKYGYKYDPENARKILTAAGYKIVDGKLMDKTGQPLPLLHVSCPLGWTDWETTIKFVVEGFKDIGIDAKEKFVDYNDWWNELISGRFEMTMQTVKGDVSPSIPWSRFAGVLSSDGLKPVPEEMYDNFGRYKNPKADAILEQILTKSTEEEVVKAYRELNILFMQDLPVLPLMYRPWHFYGYSTKHWTNFPSESNPYAPPQCIMVGSAIKTLWQLKPAE